MFYEFFRFVLTNFRQSILAEMEAGDKDSSSGIRHYEEEIISCYQYKIDSLMNSFVPYSIVAQGGISGMVN